MKKWTKALLTSMCLTIAAHSAESFSRSLSPADFSAAGLNHLSPAELAKLDALINRPNILAESPKTYPTPADDEMRRVPNSAASASSAPSLPPAPPTPPVPTDPKQSLLHRAKVLLTPGTEIEYAAMDSELAEPFRGWQKGTVLTLANGQRWQVTDGHYATPPVKGPVKVRVVPGALGSFFMEIEGGGKPRVRFLSKAP